MASSVAASQREIDGFKKQVQGKHPDLMKGSKERGEGDKKDNESDDNEEKDQMFETSQISTLKLSQVRSAFQENLYKLVSEKEDLQKQLHSTRK